MIDNVCLPPLPSEWRRLSHLHHFMSYMTREKGKAMASSFVFDLLRKHDIRSFPWPRFWSSVSHTLWRKCVMRSMTTSGWRMDILQHRFPLFLPPDYESGVWSSIFSSPTYYTSELAKSMPCSQNKRHAWAQPMPCLVVLEINVHLLPHTMGIRQKRMDTWLMWDNRQAARASTVWGLSLSSTNVCQPLLQHF